MSVIGIDFGNESCYVAAAKAGGIETLANDYSLRATPSCVAFDGKKRIIGVAAKNQQVTNMKNTVSNFKMLMGRKFNDPHVQKELASIPTVVEQQRDGSIGFKVNYLSREQHFTPEQLTAMLFTKLKETSTTALQAQVNDCVIACPVYYTNAERKALLDAAQIAGLNVLRLMNETTATALSYGFYKQDLPEDKPRNVIFVDCGQSSLQVSACAFNKGKLKMLASTWDQIGGRDIDAILADHLAKEFQERYKVNAKSNARAYLRLLTEVEKLKKQMSANSTRLPLGIECFMDDIDVSSHMQRGDMENLCAHLFQRVEVTFRKLLEASKLDLADIHSVEVVGGSTRIPAIKHLIEVVFGKPASTTLNQDEAVSRGAALQCAIMSPAVRVREFNVTDIQNYPVKVSWPAGSGVTASEVEVFPRYHAAPFSRLLTLNRREPFSLTLEYAQAVPYPDSVIGTWHVKDVKPVEQGDFHEFKVKVRINAHGIVLISSASMVDKKEAADDNGEMQTSQTPDEKATNAEANGTEPMDTNQENAGDKQKGKKSTKLIELPMDVETHGYTQHDMQSLIQKESEMIANDAKETERVNARNELEEYIYDLRNKLQGGPYERFVLEADRNTICAQLNDLENWLYEDGDDCEKETYVAKLKNLHNDTDAIAQRAHNYENCPKAFEDLKNVIAFAHKAYEEFRAKSPKYDHLTETDFMNISESAEKTQKWLDKHLSDFSQTPPHADCPVKYADVRREIDSLTSVINSVVKRPKPTKPAAKNASPKDNDAKNATSEEQNGAPPADNENSAEQQQQQPHHNADMEVD